MSMTAARARSQPFPPASEPGRAVSARPPGRRSRGEAPWLVGAARGRREVAEPRGGAAASCRPAAACRLPVVCLAVMLGLLAVGGLRAAQLLPAPPPAAALLTTASGSSLLSVGPAGDITATALTRPLALLVPRGATALGFSGDRVCELAAGGALRERRRFPWPIRRAAALADGCLLLLAGGTPSLEGLCGARVVFWNPDTDALRVAAQVRADWNPYELAVGPAPQSGRWQWVLVAVRKPAPFDPPVRRRPFLFGYRSGAADLHPLWKGTSLAHPFVSLALSTPAEGSTELLALETLAGEGRQVAGYHFSGLMQMERASAPLPLGEALYGVDGAAAAQAVVGEHSPGGWRAVVLAPQERYQGSGVCPLLVRLQTPLLEAAPLAWLPVARPRPGVLVLSSVRQVRFVPLEPPR